MLREKDATLLAANCVTLSCHGQGTILCDYQPGATLHEIQSAFATAPISIEPVLTGAAPTPIVLPVSLRWRPGPPSGSSRIDARYVHVRGNGECRCVPRGADSWF